MPGYTSAPISFSIMCMQHMHKGCEGCLCACHHQHDQSDTEELMKPDKVLETMLAIEEMSAKATPGPWLTEPHGFVGAIIGNFRRQVASVVGDAPAHGDHQRYAPEIQQANATLIVTLRNEASELIAEITKLRKETHELCARLERVSLQRVFAEEKSSEWEKLAQKAVREAAAAREDAARMRQERDHYRELAHKQGQTT